MINILIFILISAIRYLISGFFAFFTFDDSKNSVFSKIVTSSVVYTIILIVFKEFISDSPVVTFISALAICGCLIVVSEFKNCKWCMAYALFISCILEYSHFLIFKTISVIRRSLEMPEVTYTGNLNLLIFRATVVLAYATAILIIYKFCKTRIKSIIKLSEYKIFHIFLVMTLCVIVYLKYYIKYTNSNEFHNVLSIIFSAFIVVFFAFVVSSKRFVEMIDRLQKKKINPAFEEAILQKGKRYEGLVFKSQELNLEMEQYKNYFSEIGMNTGDNKVKTIAHAAVLLSHEENPNFTYMKTRVYQPISEILGISQKAVDSNIRNAIQNHWGSRDSEIIKKIKENYHGKVSQTGAPTPKDFLLYFVEKRKNEDMISESNTKFKFSILKKCFIHNQ